MKDIPETEEDFGPLAGTAWMHGFMDGRADGFRVGLKMGLITATRELERMISKTGKDPEVELAQKIVELERQLSEIGFVRVKETEK